MPNTQNSCLTVAVLGASAKPQRYSYQCVERLEEHGHRVIPVTPAQTEICGLMPVPDLAAIEEDVDILTVYVNAQRSSDMEEEILNLNPTKVIFNPGAENDLLTDKCNSKGILTENACSLVLLNTGQFKI